MSTTTLNSSAPTVRDWASTEFLASAATIAGVWAVGVQSGAERRWTLAITTALAALYVLCKGFQNRQSVRRPWSNSTLFVTVGQVVAVVAAAAANKVSLGTASLAIALAISAYGIAWALKAAHVEDPAAPPSDSEPGRMRGLVVGYAPPLAARSTPAATAARSKLAISLRPARLMDYFEGVSGAPLSEPVRALAMREDPPHLPVRQWEASDAEVPVHHIREETGLAILIDVDNNVLAIVEVDTDDHRELIAGYCSLIARGLPLRARRVSAERLSIRLDADWTAS